MLLTFPTLPARAEKVPLSQEGLRKTATHVITGQVTSIYQRSDKAGDWNYTKYVAELRVNECEKGDGINKGELLYVRYWTKAWIGRGEQPPDTSGHRGLPRDGQSIRVYLARNAYDGFGTSKDGGFNVIGANGFEEWTPPANATESGEQLVEIPASFQGTWTLRLTSDNGGKTYSSGGNQPICEVSGKEIKFTREVDFADAKLTVKAVIKQEAPGGSSYLVRFTNGKSWKLSEAGGSITAIMFEQEKDAAEKYRITVRQLKN
jgi:hypothetical protein